MNNHSLAILAVCVTTVVTLDSCGTGRVSGGMDKSCDADRCKEQGKNCGAIEVEGCGPVQCGECESNQACGGGGTPNVCGVGSCTPGTCEEQRVSCGTVSDGCAGLLDCGVCPGDTTVPSVPTGLQASATSCSTVQLSWTESTDTGGSGLKGYRLFRDASFLKQVDAPATSTTDSGRSASTSYAYGVSAIDNAGNESAKPASVMVSTPPCTVSGTTYYVSPTGDNAKNGLTEATAWRTLTYAASASSPVAPGDTVYIKAGNYGAEHVDFKKSGTESKPIVFEGYKTIPADSPNLGYKYGDTLNAAVMPLFDGGNRVSGTALSLSDSQYLILRNLQISKYALGIYNWGMQHVTLDNIIAMTFGDVDASYSGHGIIIESPSHHNLVKDCVVVNASAELLSIRGDYNVVENCKVFSDENQTPNASADYYVSVGGSYNTITGCHAERVGDLAHGGHGFNIKGNNAQYNVIESCTTNMHFKVRWRGVKHNTINNCHVNGGSGLEVRDGASDNTFSNCTVENGSGIVFLNTGEDNGFTDYVGRNNTFKNCIFKNNYYGIRFFYYSEPSPADYNTIENSVFYNTTYLFNTQRVNHNNLMINSIVSKTKYLIDTSDSRQQYPLDFTFAYTDFYDNDFPAPTGTDNNQVDPLFADSATGDFHLKSKAGRWTPSGWVQDAVHSFCIDAGDPAGSFSEEPSPNGGRVNMGAYGNTAQASKSW